MTDQQITNEATKYSSSIDFTDDRNLSEKGRKRVREWATTDFIAGAKFHRKNTNHD